MSRISIEVSEQQHQRIKALAALNGHSIKDYIIEKILSSVPADSEDVDEKQALAELEALLAPRIAAAERGEFSDISMEEIIAEAQAQHQAH